MKSAGTRIYLTIIWIVTIICILIGVNRFIIGNGYGGKSIKKVVALDEVSKIDIDLPIGDLNIKEGNEFKLEIEASKKLMPDWKIEGDTLRIKGSSKGVSFFSFGNQVQKVTLTIPRDHVIERADLSLDMGNIEIEDVELNDVYIEADMGNVVARKIEASFYSVEADMGNVEISGDVFNIEADCDMGNIDIDVDNLNKCIISAEADLGNVTVNGEDEGNKFISR